MKRIVAFLIIMMAVGCASKVELESARVTLNRARNCKEVKKYASAELRDAETSYGKALNTNHPDDAYMAKRKADLALARGAARAKQEELDKLAATKKAKHDEMALLKAELEEKERLLKEKEAQQSDAKKEFEDAMKGIGEVKKEDRGLVLYMSDILFDFNRAGLRSGTIDALGKIGTVLKNHPNYKIRVEGHTDSVGSAAYNQKLSVQRAKVVGDFFIKDGVETGRIKTVGYGEEKPLVSNKTAEGRQRNRRVEIIVAE